jgi:hypothetical protein
MGEVHALHPRDTMAVLYNIDDAPGFGLTLCNEQSLVGAVHAALFGAAVPTPESAREVTAVAEQLRESGSVDFEDSWIMLRVGMAGVVAYLMERLDEAKAEERFADQERAEAHRKAGEANSKYTDLCAVLSAAIGDKFAPLVSLAELTASAEVRQWH